MPFPANVLSLADAIGSQFLSVFFGGSVPHSTGINQMKADLIAAEIKLGTSEAAPGDTPLANTVLASSTNAKSKWRQIASADLAGGIAASKLAPGAANSALTSNGATNAFSTQPTLDALNVATTGAASGEVKTNGAVKAGAGVYPSGQVTLFHSAPIVAVSPLPGNSALIGSNARFGFVDVYDASVGLCARFSIHGPGNSTALHSGQGANFGVAAANDNRIHCIYNSGNYFLYNGYGAPHALYASFSGG